MRFLSVYSGSLPLHTKSSGKSFINAAATASEMPKETYYKYKRDLVVKRDLALCAVSITASETPPGRDARG